MKRLRARDVRANIAPDRSVSIDFELDAGCALQLTGPSGSGKSTLLRLLARLDAQVSGDILLEGRSSTSVAPPEWRRQVVYVAQQPTMLGGTVLDNLLAGYAPADRARQPKLERERLKRERHAQAVNLLSGLGLESTEAFLHQIGATLSGGEAARVALGRAMLMQPRVLLLDEPTANLDCDTADALVTVVCQWVAEGGSLVLVAHDEGPWRRLSRPRIAIA